MILGRAPLLASVLAVQACAGISAQPIPPPVRIADESMHCSDLEQLDAALNARDEDYFERWSSEDYARAEKWVKQCAPAPIFGKDGTTPARLHLLGLMHAKAQAKEEQIKERMHRQARCRDTERYRAYNAQNEVLRAVRAKAAAEEILAQEQRVAEGSGVINLKTAHDAGEMIAWHDRTIREFWRQYKAAGGSAASPAELPTIAVNPCPTN